MGGCSRYVSCLVCRPLGTGESRVPITWTIDHDRRMLTAVCQGDVTLLDLEEYLDAVVVAGSMPYRKLFDGTGGDSALTDEEMMLLGARIRAYHMAGPMGPLAIVVVTENTHGLARPGRRRSADQDLPRRAGRAALAGRPVGIMALFDAVEGANRVALQE